MVGVIHFLVLVGALPHLPHRPEHDQGEGDEDVGADVDDEGASAKEEDAEEDGTEDAPVEDFVLEVLVRGLGEAEGFEDEVEGEQVVHRQRLLEHIAGGEKTGHLRAARPPNETGKRGGARHPNERPHGRVPHRDDFALFVAAQVDRDSNDEGDQERENLQEGDSAEGGKRLVEHNFKKDYLYIPKFRLRKQPPNFKMSCSGRKSVFGQVRGFGVQEEQFSAIVAPKGFQAHQRLVTGLAPELAGPLEACLLLPTGGFHRPAAQRLAFLFGRLVVHPLAVAVKVVDLLLHLLLGRSLEPPLELFQLGDDFAALIGLELGHERFDPRVRRRVVVGMQCARHGPEVLADVVVVHALAGTGKAAPARFHIHTAPSSRTNNWLATEPVTTHCRTLIFPPLLVRCEPTEHRYRPESTENPKQQRVKNPPYDQQENQRRDVQQGGRGGADRDWFDDPTHGNEKHLVNLVQKLDHPVGLRCSDPAQDNAGKEAKHKSPHNQIYQSRNSLHNTSSRSGYARKLVHHLDCVVFSNKVTEVDG